MVLATSPASETLPTKPFKRLVGEAPRFFFCHLVILFSWSHITQPFLPVIVCASLLRLFHCSIPNECVCVFLCACFILGAHTLSSDIPSLLYSSPLLSSARLCFRRCLVMKKPTPVSMYMLQYAYRGTGMDLPLLQWLETHTFPVEARFEDPSFARKV